MPADDPLNPSSTDSGGDTADQSVKDNIKTVFDALKTVVSSGDFTSTDQSLAKRILNRGSYGVLEDKTVSNDLVLLRKSFDAQSKKDYSAVVTSLIDALQKEGSRVEARSAMAAPKYIRVDGSVYELAQPDEAPEFIKVNGQVFCKITTAEAQSIVAKKKAKKKPWGKLPKGWTRKSAKEFWESIGGRVTTCVRKIKKSDSGIDDPGAFCASLARSLGEKVTRGKGKSKS